MGELRAFRGRSYHRSQGCLKGGRCSDEYGRGCYWCEAGLFTCLHCGASEGALATDCPRTRTTADQDDAVLAGRLDYVVAAGGWVTRSNAASLPPAVRQPVPVCEEV